MTTAADLRTSTRRARCRHPRCDGRLCSTRCDECNTPVCFPACYLAHVRKEHGRI
jgi:hypothetical protein